MKDLKVTCIQSTLAWEDPKTNRAHFESHFSGIKEETDVIVLCEMFTTGFSMAPERIAEKFHPQMETLAWMRSWSEKLNAAITGSVSVEENGKYFNRLLWVEPGGNIATYDKRHTFNYADEGTHYAQGTKRLIVDWRGWKICPLVCYDLRFPVWSRNDIRGGSAAYDMLIYVANWPVVRIEPWKKLLLARAIENQSYVAGVNCVGTDGNGHVYSGESSFINPRGEYLYQLASGSEDVATQVFSWDELQDFRKKFPVLNDADDFSIA